MKAGDFVLPGEQASSSDITSGHEKALVLGPGLRFELPDSVTSTSCGSLIADSRKNALWVEAASDGRYTPTTGDLVIVVVHHTSSDFYHCRVTPFAPFALLPQLAFEGATKKTRPVLQPGSLVYARVSLANRHMEPELECVFPTKAGKADGLGELTGGMVFDISISMTRRLMRSKPKEDGHLVILEALADRGFKFEIAVGQNGRLWIRSETVKSTNVVGRAVQQTDRDRLSISEQQKLARRLADFMSNS